MMEGLVGLIRIRTRGLGCLRARHDSIHHTKPKGEHRVNGARTGWCPRKIYTFELTVDQPDQVWFSRRLAESDSPRAGPSESALRQAAPQATRPSWSRLKACRPTDSGLAVVWAGWDGWNGTVVPRSVSRIRVPLLATGRRG